MGNGRVREGFARAADVVPLSARGAVLLLGCALALQYYGRVERDLVLLVVASTGLALIALACGGVLIGALRVRAVLGRAPQGPRRLSAEVGRSSASGFALPRLRGLPWVDAELEWLAPAEVECETRARRGRLEEWIRPRRRFEVGRVQRRIALGDAFGLARFAWRCDRAQLVSALPATTLVGVPPLAARAAGDDETLPSGAAQGDRLDSRPYQPGDPSRHILWRSWARSRELFVRTPERSAAAAQRTAVYLVCGPGDEPAAGAARAALESGVLGDDWRLGADGCAEEARDAHHALSLLARSGGARGATRFADFAAKLEREADRALLIFAPAEAGPWIEGVERALHARRGASAIVLALDRAPAAASRRRFRQRHRPRSAEAAELLRARLARVARVVVVERSAGASGAAAALAALGRSA